MTLLLLINRTLNIFRIKMHCSSYHGITFPIVLAIQMGLDFESVLTLSLSSFSVTPT